MTSMQAYYRPLKLAQNRVWRTYTGGRLLDQWQGRAQPADSNVPEEWVASLVTARNPGRDAHSAEGLSYLHGAGAPLSLKALIEADPEAFLGAAHAAAYGAHLAVLIKVLDSAERLTIQVHPDTQTARRLFRSDFGKTEAWYVLGGRQAEGQEPYVLLGFRPGITRERWVALFEAQDIAGMIDALHRIPVRPGQALLVEGGVPHAIGPGCFLLEIQEPTDYTIRVERVTPQGLAIPDLLCHQGLGFQTMFDCFHYEACSLEEQMRRAILAPRLLRDGPDFSERELIGPGHTAYFGLRLTDIFTEYALADRAGFAVAIVLEGCGTLAWDSGSAPVAAGETFFIPACARQVRLTNRGGGPLRLIQGFPPRSG